MLSGVLNDTTVSCVVCNDVSDPSTLQGSPLFLQPTSANVFPARSHCVKVSAAAGLIPPASSRMSNGRHAATVSTFARVFHMLIQTRFVLQNAICCDVRRASPPRSNVPLDDDGQQEGPAGGPISRTRTGRGRIVKRSVPRHTAICKYGCW